METDKPKDDPLIKRLDLVGQRNDRARATLLDRFAMGNPAADLISIRAQKSESATLGFWQLDDPAYYDAHDEMVRKDPTIASAISLIVSQISAREMTFVAKDPNDADAVRRADLLSDAVNSRLLLDACNYFIGGALRHGISTCEIEWRAVSGMFFPAKLHHQHPGLFKYSFNGDQYFLGEKLGGEPTNPWKYATMRFPALYGNPYGNAPLDAVSILYFIKKECLKGWADYSYRFGLPLVIATINESVDERIAARKAELQQQLEDLAASAGIIIPESVKVVFEDRKGGQSNAPFEPLIKWCDTQILRFLYGSTLGVAESEFGTRAQAEVHAATGSMKHKNTAALFADAVQQVVDSWVEINFGKQFVGSIVFDVDTDDAKDLDEAIKALDQATKMGLEISESQVRDWLNLPKPDGQDALTAPIPTTEVSTAPTPFSEDRLVDIPSTDRRRILTVANTDKALLSIADSALETTAPELIKFASEGRQIELPEDVERAMEASVIVSLASELARYNGDDSLKTPFERIASFAEYQGREVELDKPFRTPDGPKKYAVYVRNENGNVIRLPFGDPDSEIKRDDPERRANFRARHNCDDPGPKWKARYWSCRFWADESVSDLLKASEGCGCGCGKSLVSFAEISDIDPRFRQAVEWMRDRRVLPTETLNAIVESLAAMPEAIAAQYTTEQIAQLVRGRVAAFKLAVDTQQASAIQAAIVQATNKGVNVAEFLRSADGQQAIAGKFSDGYLRNVFRTETSNAYSAQQQQFEKLPVVTSQLWGHKVVNPEDSRSRDSHAALDGKYFKAGSPASIALGRPPFSYQCRCVLVPITNRQAEREGIVESPDAMALANSLERF